MDDRNYQLIILGHVCKFALKCKNLYRIGPRKSVKIFTGLTPGRTSRTGAKSGEVFSGWWADGGGRGPTADEKECKNFPFMTPGLGVG